MKEDELDEVRLWNRPARLPNGVLVLNDRLSQMTVNGHQLDSVCQRRIAGYRGKYQPISSDGYRWFAAFEFYRNGRMIYLAVPWKADNRSVTIFADEDLSEAELNKLCRRFLEVLCEIAGD